MANINTTTAAVMIDEAFSKRVQHHTESKLALWNRIARFDDMASKSGNKVNIPFDTELVANNKVSGVSVSPQNPTDSEVELLLNIHKESSFRIEDIAEFQAHVAVRDRYAKNAGYAVGKA